MFRFLRTSCITAQYRCFMSYLRFYTFLLLQTSSSFFCGRPDCDVNFYLLSMHSEVSFVRFLQVAVVKTRQGGTDGGTRLKTAFHAREHNCWRKFHLTAFKIPQQTAKNASSDIRRSERLETCCLTVSYEKVIIVSIDLARKPVSSRKQRHLCSETGIGVLQRTQSKISLS